MVNKGNPPQMALFQVSETLNFTQNISGWWWLEHDWIIFPEILGIIDHPKWRTHIFQRGREKTTNQTYKNTMENLSSEWRDPAFLMGKLISSEDMAISNSYIKFGMGQNHLKYF